MDFRVAQISLHITTFAPEIQSPPGSETWPEMRARETLLINKTRCRSVSLWLMFSSTCAEQCKPLWHFQPRWRHAFSLPVCGSVSHSVQSKYKISFSRPSSFSQLIVPVCSGLYLIITHLLILRFSVCALDQCSSVFYTPGASFIHWFVHTDVHVTVVSTSLSQSEIQHCSSASLVRLRHCITM